jgi:glycerol-3-phosphate dehydrogenase
MKKIAAVDVVIIGGGVAGLWLLNRLRQTKLTTILLESNTLGGGQTHKAQGIIHGGMKYALQGVFTAEAQAMAVAPAIWQQCLQGQGEVNLSAVPILSTQHYLWAPYKFTAKLASFLAGMALTSQVKSLAREAYPTVLQHPQFQGEVYALNEMVIDVPALVRELAQPNQDAIFKILPLCESDLFLDKEGNLQAICIETLEQKLEISAQQFVFVAGAGNAVIINKLKQTPIAMQYRPLHMVLVKTPMMEPLYAHCLGWGVRPRLTVTTHYTVDGHMIWYLGGALAEKGVGRDRQTQIKAAQEELRALFPWVDWSAAEFATLMVDRVEPLQSGGRKPETVCATFIQNITIAWPTKLALAPVLAANIIQHFTDIRVCSQWLDKQALSTWPTPVIARPVWEDAFCKNVY